MCIVNLTTAHSCEICASEFCGSDSFRDVFHWEKGRNTAKRAYLKFVAYDWRHYDDEGSSGNSVGNGLADKPIIRKLIVNVGIQQNSHDHCPWDTIGIGWLAISRDAKVESELLA